METNNLWNKEVVIVGLSFILEKDFSVQLGNHHRLKILLPKKKNHVWTNCLSGISQHLMHTFIIPLLELSIPGSVSNILSHIPCETLSPISLAVTLCLCDVFINPSRACEGFSVGGF